MSLEEDLSITEPSMSLEEARRLDQINFLKLKSFIPPDVNQRRYSSRELDTLHLHAIGSNFKIYPYSINELAVDINTFGPSHTFLLGEIIRTLVDNLAPPDLDTLRINMVENNYDIWGSQNGLGKTVTDLYEARKTQIMVRNQPSSIKDALYKAGIPEELIETNPDLCEFIKTAEENVAHTNRSFNLVSNSGESYFLKIHTDKVKADIEAAANYFLHPELEHLIIPGKSPKSLLAGDYHITIQKSNNNAIKVAKSVEYWVTSLALFHRAAEDILRRNKVQVPQFPFHETNRYIQRQRQGETSLKIDKKRLTAAIQYLSLSSYQNVIHGDTKGPNRMDHYLVDLERISIGDPRIDLAPVLIEYQVPQERHQELTNLYLSTYFQASVEELPNSQLAEFTSGLPHAMYFSAVREHCGASLRELNKAQEPHVISHRKFLLAV